MAFFEDPRLRQRWNRLSYNAGEVTENAAAGIWTFQNDYINPCLASVLASLEDCTAPCLGDREERARRQRDKQRARGNAEYSFDFYDDWYADEEELFFGNGGDGSNNPRGAKGSSSRSAAARRLLGGFGGEDWDRLLAGTGAQRKHTGGEGGSSADVHAEQPRRKRGMSYGTRSSSAAAASGVGGGHRRKAAGEQDPTVIPSTQPIGFLGRLPWKLGKTLRYKPSAADLQDHPRQHGVAGETEPLLMQEAGDSSLDDEIMAHGHTIAGQRVPPSGRKRSGTAGSGDTSDSYRSRGDLFPSDEEGEEDAVPLDDDEFTMVLDKMGTGGSSDDRSSGKTRTSKGKRPAGLGSRTVSRATMDSVRSRNSSNPTLGQQQQQHVQRVSSGASSIPPTPSSMEDLQLEEDRIRREEDAEVQRRRRAAAALAIEKGLRDSAPAGAVVSDDDDSKGDPAHVEVAETDESQQPVQRTTSSEYVQAASAADDKMDESPSEPSRRARKPSDSFTPARLPHFR